MTAFTCKGSRLDIGKYWFPEKGRRIGESAAPGCAHRQPGYLEWAIVGWQGDQVPLALATAFPADEATVKSVLKDELEGVHGVNACLLRKAGEGGRWLIAVVASTGRSKEPVRARVAGRMEDIEVRLPFGCIEFSVYSKHEIDWPDCMGRLLADYTRVF